MGVGFFCDVVREELSSFWVFCVLCGGHIVGALKCALRQIGSCFVAGASCVIVGMVC